MPQFFHGDDGNDHANAIAIPQVLSENSPAKNQIVQNIVKSKIKNSCKSCG